MEFIRRKIVLLLPLVLCACTPSLELGKPHTKQNFKKTSPAIRQHNLLALRQFQISGAFGVTTPTQSHIANFSWQIKNKHNYTFSVTAPADLEQVLIENRHSKLVYWQSNQKPIRIQSLSEFMQAQFGWSVPLNALYYWIRGMALPGTSARRYDQYGHLLSLQQKGWVLHYSRYIHYSKFDLPTQIRAQNPASDKFRIAIRRWNFTTLNKTSAPSQQDLKTLKSV